ncbi:MAG: hypothetical protein Kow0059_00710 [Candidatus Sumerlaeia bacterium]
MIPAARWPAAPVCAMIGFKSWFPEAARRFGVPPPAVVQVDLDGYWAIRRCYGRGEDGTFQRDPVYFDGLKRALAVFRETNVKAVFFVVGRDAELANKAELLQRVAAEGHAIANHTWTHLIHFAQLQPVDMSDEIRRAQDAIGRSVGVEPVWFRAPGYAMTAEMMRIVRQAGFRGDSSVLPSPWGPVFRGVSRLISLGSQVERGRQFGLRAAAGAPMWPYTPSEANFTREAVRSDGGDLVEWPVSVDPLTRLPLTGTILLLLGWGVFRRALLRARRMGLPLNFVLHGIDFVDTRIYLPLDSIRGNAWFWMAPERKRRSIASALEFIRRHWRMAPIRENAPQLADRHDGGSA